MGVVYLAVRPADGAVVALKTVTPEVRAAEKEVKRFLRESSILQQLDHPHIVACRDMGEAEGQLFFAMDFVPGPDADQLLESQGPLPVGRAVRLVCQLLEALEYAHARKFVHRDIKPGNLLVTAEAGREVAKLTDFGLARVYQASPVSGITLAGQAGAAGTPAFMPPEQITNFREAKPAADLYSTGATLYTLLTDRPYQDLEGRAINEIIFKVLMDPPVPIRTHRPEIPAGLADVIHRALEKSPVKRFADARAMRAALLPFGG